MSIAPILQRYLAAENIPYDEIAHEPTMSSTRTAQACHVSGDRVAKGIVLRHDSGYLLAVMPASHRYGLNLIVDDTIGMQPEIYMEAGDHETLLHMSGAEFARLTANALHGRFSVHD
jgi:Ala-tRNA(Pro) deacylase